LLLRRAGIFFLAIRQGFLFHLLTAKGKNTFEQSGFLIGQGKSPSSKVLQSVWAQTGFLTSGLQAIATKAATALQGGKYVRPDIRGANAK
jgi:hypothetical protein